MTKVNVKTTTDFVAESDFGSGQVTRVKEQLNQMFEALERYENDKGIKLTDVTINTREGNNGERKYIISARNTDMVFGKR